MTPSPSRRNFARACQVLVPLTRSARDRRHLMELVLCIVQEGDPDYFQPAFPDHFHVIDMRTGELAIFQREPGATDEQITGMVASFFDARPRVVALRTWAA